MLKMNVNTRHVHYTWMVCRFAPKKLKTFYFTISLLAREVGILYDTR